MAQGEPSSQEAAYGKSVSDLRRLLANLDPPLSPRTVSGIADTDYLMRSIRKEFGLLSQDEALEILSIAQAEHIFERLDDRVIRFNYGSAEVYPGFQFDRSTRTVFRVITQLLYLRQGNFTSLGLACWLCSPSGYFDGARPVDFLDQESRVLGAARSHYQARW
ncbi:hypothetical protein [Arthrobacter pityocampae]|uniref:hypothetical protein n=1 Tax=Arthrobacter pityocampae TaxID=547334 RepID=UPI0011AFD688|nr:hypothetical protein [Arthrobacter pityocampae]